jgi:hypothetical protein
MGLEGKGRMGEEIKFAKWNRIRGPVPTNRVKQTRNGRPQTAAQTTDRTQQSTDTGKADNVLVVKGWKC